MSLLTKATRIESLDLHLLHVKGVKLVVLRALSKWAYLTRSELNKHTGLRVSTLCSALKSLEDEGWVRVAFDTLDTETNRNVATYTPTHEADKRIGLAAGIVREHWEPKGEEAL